MVDLDDAIIARLESHGETFEVLLDPKALDLLRQGKKVDMIKYLAVEDVFTNAGKGTHPSAEKIEEAFGTDDISAITSSIIEKGDVQVTAAQRKDILENKMKQVITYISTNAIDPQTKLPHPPMRIKLALEGSKYHVDLFRPLDKEVEMAMKVLRPILPIRFEKSKVAVKLEGTDYSRCYNDLAEAGTIQKEEWTDDGHWIGIIEIPGGALTEVTHKLKQKTKGSASVKLIS